MPRATIKVEKEVRNTHEQLVAAGGGIALIKAYGGVRTRYFNGWHVYRIKDGKRMVTDANAAWYDNKMKHFHVMNKDEKDTVLEQAIQWVADTYGYTGEWVRNRMQDYVLKDVNKRFPIRDWRKEDRERKKVAENGAL